MPVLFVTGTDTGVGKTRIACALAAAFRSLGRRVAVMKPIESGCAIHDGELHPADAAALRLAAGSSNDLELICPIRLATPASPEAASAREGRPIDLSLIDAAARRLAEDSDLLLVEGAGGLLVPIDARNDMADLAARLSAHLLVVARASLGTVNHSLLTLEAARRRCLPVAGVVLNRVVAHRGPDEESNGAAIASRGRTRILGVFPHVATDLSPEALARLAREHLDLPALVAIMQ